ncbi:PREDICTED: reverse mRNAase, partial [Prunus dulcis]
IIWESKTLPKVKQFLWRAVSNILPSFLNLHKRRLSSSHLCPICLESPESIEHMLVLCPWTAYVR